MNKKTTFSLIAIVLIVVWGCTTNNQSKEIQPGFYQLTKTETTHAENISILQKLGFQSGIIHIIDKDSLAFVGQNTMGDLLWGHSQFNYKIKGKRIVLKSGDFKKKIKFEITPDNLLKLETNAENMTNVYFEPLEINLAGKYRVYSFMKKEGAPDNEILTFAQNVFRKESFDFVSNNKVIIQPNLAQLLTGSAVPTDTVFNYNVLNNEITFSNASHSVSVPYVFDGIFRLTIDNSNFERIDIDKIQG